MSGRKQHYIPQCLLKGFETPSRGKTKKVWIFKKGQQPFISPTQDVATERHFYSELSKDGALTLDDRITQYENELGKLLNLLHEAPLDSPVDATIAAEVITHLTIRGAYLRDLFSIGVKHLIVGVTDLVSDKESLRMSLGMDADEPPPVFQEQIEKILSGHADFFARINVPKPILRQMAFTLTKENFDRFHADQSPELIALLNEMTSQTSTVLRTGHAKALASSLKPDPRVESLSQLEWKIHAIPEGDLILPDCVALSIQSNSTIPEPCILTELEKINIVLFPLCAKKLLIGHRAETSLPDVQGFNQAAAACSHTFFVSASKTDEIECLADSISELSQKAILEAVMCSVAAIKTKSSFEKHLSRTMLRFTEEPILSVTTIEKTIEHSGTQKKSSPQPPNYPVIFLNCADQETAKQIATAVNVVVSEISHSMTLGRLDRITFAGDYAEALRNIERGFSVSRPLVPTETDFGTGIAMTPLILRDGVAKACIVMQAWLGNALIGEDRDTQTIAIHTLVNQLAHVACIDLIDNALPEILMSRIEDNWEAWLYAHMHEAWTAYFAARISARFNPAGDSGYRDILLAALDRIQESIPRERLDYRFHGNFDRFLQSTISAIGPVLIYMGTLLGHCDGLCQSAYDEEGSLTQALEKIGLHNWVDTFRRDLVRLFERQGKWESGQEFLALNRHMERVLWQFGLFPWRNDQGQVRVEIPLGTGAAQLLKSVEGQYPLKT